MPARLLAMLLGYAAAVLVASLVITLAIWLPSFARDISRADFGFPLVVLSVSLVAVAAFTVVPTVLALVYAEHQGIRALRAYVAFGAALGALGLLVGLVFFTAPPGAGAGVAVALVAGGILGGLAYWRIAGRNAGALP